MLRIPNPGSDIDKFIRIFQDLHSELKNSGDFDLDDMTRAMIARNNVSSQGAFGQEALRRSTRANRSLDPLYNQSKAYAELFRTFGWIQSTTSALRFAFSWLGEHAAVATFPELLTKECLLGMAYPNDVLGVQGDQSVRVFSAILRTAAALDGSITRDEMIVGPLNIADDRNEATFLEMVQKLRVCRRNPALMESEINALSVARGITHVTMTNYTRFPIGAVQWAGWCINARRALVLTEEGHRVVATVAGLRDIRVSDYKNMPADAKAPFIRLSFHDMLSRAQFDVSQAANQMTADRATLAALGVPTTPEPLFSPYQQLSRAEVNAAFPHLRDTVEDRTPISSRPLVEIANPGRVHAKANVVYAFAGIATTRDDETTLLERELRADLSAAGNLVAGAIEAFYRRHAFDNQNTFYPLVATLFRTIGYECRISRRGVNYDRADAMIVDDANSIPIEIKSPGEEIELSVKAIRQAVENKIILLSRQQFPTRRPTTTLAVGFNPPNARSEVRELIENVYQAYGFNVGVLDIRSLVALALAAIQAGSKLKLNGFVEMRGVVDVADFIR
ncbi:hypothetical protein [Caballeronia zhejiangensis]|uniref:hypothetical protein n=1 Tax=Caballeronia zhejiangensis TaxID=871203 RepID=UPI001F51B1E1|nr:hypothetical protein [Caballeronia zhejiangensis]MCI1041826.1 hypothetical protein [Caballeronia zhejiangensis]